MSRFFNIATYVLMLATLLPSKIYAQDTVKAAAVANSNMILRPSRISIDPTGAYVDRDALITTYREVTSPKEMTASAYFLQDVKGDNIGFKGATGVYIQTRDKPGIGRAQRGVLYGAAITLVPSFDRDNYPADDVTGVVVQNDGVGRGTEALYIGRGSHKLAQGDWLAVFGADAWADTGLYLRGHYRFGMDLATPGLNSVLSGAVIRVPASAPSIITVRNSQDTEERPVLATQRDGTLLIDGAQVRKPVSWSPTLTSDSGKIALFHIIESGTRYSVINYRCFADITIYIDDVGTAAGSIRFKLPVQHVPGTSFVAYGHRSDDSVMLVGTNIANDLRVTRYDGLNPLRNKTYITISFNYEVSY